MAFLNGDPFFLKDFDNIPFSADIPRFLIYFYIAFSGYLLAIYFIRKKDFNYFNQNSPAFSSDVPLLQIFFVLLSTKGFKKQILFLILITLFMRLPFLISHPTPDLSDDIYRYYWDGKVQNYNYNPYHYAPKDFPDRSLKDSYFHKINHPDIPTIYAPFLQILYKLSYRIYPSLYTFKVLAMIFDVLSILVLFLLLLKLGMNIHFIVIYAWNPLILIEFYHSGHSDSVLCFLILLVIYFYINSQKGLSIISLALLTLTKYFGIVLLPFYFRKISWKYFILYFVVILLAYLYYWNENIFSGFLKYGQYWKYNSFIYKGIYLVTNHEQVPKLILGLVFMGLYLIKWWELVKNDQLFIKNTFFVFGLILLFSPVFHPWYLTIMIPILSIFYNRSWILFSGLIILSYIIRMDFYLLNIWKENEFVILLEYIPFYILMVYDYVRSKLNMA